MADPDEQIVDLWSRSDENSILNQVPATMQQRFIEASQKEPGLFGIDERALWKILKSGRQPSPTDNRLRLAFWFEFDRSQSEGRKMDLANVYSGVCLKEYFYNTYMKNASKVAWLLCIPTSYDKKIHEALDFAMERMRDILDEDPESYPMSQRVKFKELQAKIFVMLDQRAKGSYLQRQEIKQMNLNVHSSDKGVAQAVVDNNVEALENRLRELEKRERKALNLPEPKVTYDIVVK